MYEGICRRNPIAKCRDGIVGSTGIYGGMVLAVMAWGMMAVMAGCRDVGMVLAVMAGCSGVGCRV